MKTLRLSCLTLAALGAMAALPTWAAPVLTANTAAFAPLGTPGSTTNYGTPPTYAGSQSFASNTVGNAGSFAFSNQFGTYAVSSNATGRAESDARASLLYTLQNTSSIAQAYSMSFYIYAGAISALVDGNTSLTLGESLLASYAARISVGGNTLFNSAVSVSNSFDTGITVTRQGTQLDEYNNGATGFYGWNGRMYNIELGILAAGASIDILAEVSTDVFANVGTYDFAGGDDGYGGYGGGCFNNEPTLARSFGEVDSTICFKGRSQAFYGDPIEFFSAGPDTANENPVSFASRPANDVPEPGSLALVGLALAAAASAARRRKS